MFYNVVVEFEKQIRAGGVLRCGTENQIECTIIDNREVAGERRTALMEYILHSLPLLTEEQLDEINHLLDEQLL